MPGEPERAAARKAALLFLSVAGLILIGDLLTKWAAFTYLGSDPHVVLRIIPGILNFRLSLNQGAVFGLGQGLRWVFVAFTLAASVGIVWGQWTYGRSSRLLTLGLGLLLGGALGNLYDRVLLASVRDFIDVYAGRHHWPTFNLADAAICVGCGLIVLCSFKTPRNEKSAASSKQ